MNRKYTDEQIEFIREYAPGHTYIEITDAYAERYGYVLRRPQLKNILANHNIKTGTKHHYEKGHIPATKGKKMPPEVYEKCKATMFKKGNAPVTTKPVGTESVWHNYKTGEQYARVKVAEPNKWELKHRLVWKEHFGEIPKGKIITFLDGNTLNCDISNLALIDRRISAIINNNKLRTEDAECNKSAIEVAKLIKCIKDAERKMK